jgi:hypothetical protein
VTEHIKQHILEAYAHIGAALVQSIPTDDQIIAGHIRDAHAELKAALQETPAQKPRGGRGLLTIHVSPEFPPIPDRSCDWAAWVDGREETTTSHGPTPAAALRQLADQIEAEEPGKAPKL